MRKITSMAFAALLAAAPVTAAWPAQAQQAQMPTQLNQQMPTQIDQSQSQMQAQFPPPFDQSSNDQTTVPSAYLALGAGAIIGLTVLAIAESQHQSVVQVSPQVSP